LIQAKVAVERDYQELKSEIGSTTSRDAPGEASTTTQRYARGATDSSPPSGAFPPTESQVTLAQVRPPSTARTAATDWMVSPLRETRQRSLTTRALRASDVGRVVKNDQYTSGGLAAERQRSADQVAMTKLDDIPKPRSSSQVAEDGNFPPSRLSSFRLERQAHRTVSSVEQFSR